jgi:multicomponent Na+:H+ antiporter subunit A
VIAVLAIHAVVATATAALARRLGRRVLLVGAIAPAASLVWLLTVTDRVAADGAVDESLAWAPPLGLEVNLRLDGFGALMVSLVGGIGVLVFVYAWRYFDDRPDLARFVSNLVLFAGAMFGIVVSDNVLVLYVFWELTSITSYLLIGFDDESAVARAGALQALLVTSTGGLAMLAGLVVVGQEAATYSLSGILAQPPSSTATGVGLALILVGALTKSAQVPFHFWLPSAMSAPTPVSAYLHSATMVKAGVYLVARLAPVFAPLFAWWAPVLVTVGVATMVVGGWRALAQYDLKLLLAQGTVSQLGFLMVLVGIGVPEATFAGMAMILAHALFKAPLFMVAGIVDHQAHTRDMRRLDRLGRIMPATFAVAAVAAASMAGIPPLLGFVTKEAALEGLVHHGAGWATAGVVLGSALTAAYGLRLLWGGFVEEGTEDSTEGEVVRPSWWFLAPPALLAATAVVAGLAPGSVDGLVGAAAEAVDPATGQSHLALWHGVGLPLGLSAVALAGGWLVWRRPPAQLCVATRRVPDMQSIYTASITGLNHLADRVTSIVQNGSLPVYVGVILTTAVVVPVVPMLGDFALPSRPRFAESPIQAATALVVVAMAVGAAVTRRRLAAVLFLGAMGYGVAVLFVIQGAPDLALTQLLVETLSLAIFVLVLRRLPTRFEAEAWRLRRLTRVVVSVAVGLFAGAFALWAAAGRVAVPLTGEFLTRAQPEGGGRNVVNVILTDIRSIDTLGEITVLTVAALGVLALAKAAIDQDDSDQVEQPEGKPT